MDYKIFEDLLKVAKISVYKVARETGISASTFTDWKKGRSAPKSDKLKILADYFGVGIGYFFGGGEESSLRGGISRKTLIPIIGEIRAGSPIITNETLLGHEPAEVDEPDEYFFLQICGDSMKDIGMVDGSLVLFKKQQYAEEGDIVACLVDGESATVKRFHKQKKGVLLLPENEKYSPISVSPEAFESGEARILGIAKEVKIKL